MDLRNTSDAHLVAWMIEGQEGCMAELVGRYGGAVGTLLRRVTGDAPDWEDLAQETWIRVIRHAERYNPDFPFAPWLFRIAWNLAMDHRKLRAREAPAPDPEWHADSARHPEAEALSSDDRARVAKALNTLPPALAELVALRYFEECSERDLAGRFEIPQGTVKSRLHTAHRRLAALLGGLR